MHQRSVTHCLFCLQQVLTYPQYLSIKTNDVCEATEYELQNYA
jgi:hypothetical protein